MLEFLEWLPNLLVFLEHPQQELVVETLIAVSQEQPYYYLLSSFDVLTTLQYYDNNNKNNDEIEIETYLHWDITIEIQYDCF